ncbi:polysaccharide deacetylase family protein [Pigmentibacter ruber]|uniref:polysaccharide deacetylase family protein n=1 Tax=Pigmentibacter ruber TaxID=2683196 RepID=UPI00131EA18B|nr:polysaccharide deacetylase family protein [Pigmentibacter ruber]
MKNIAKNNLALLYSYLIKFFPTKGVRVLMYHALNTKLPHDSYGISIDFDLFCQQIFLLKQNNYIFVPLSEVRSNLDRDKHVSISFDDGYKDNMLAARFLNNLEIPFTIFIISDFIDQQIYLSTAEIKELSNLKFCTLGAHGKTHSKLGTLSYIEQKVELETCKKLIEDITSKEIDQLSFPHGSFNQNTIEIINNIGFNLAASSLHGLNTKNNFDKYKLRRTEILGHDGLNIFQKKIEAGYDYLKFKDYILK